MLIVLYLIRAYYPIERAKKAGERVYVPAIYEIVRFENVSMLDRESEERLTSYIE